MSTNTTTELPVEHAAFLEHARRPRFVQGVEEGHWKIEKIDWPSVIITVFAPNGKVALRFDLAQYPSEPPTAAPWDCSTDALLDVNNWPTGKRADQVFARGWAPQFGNALYVPLDRKAIESHPNWVSEYPGYLWDSTKSIVDYLLLVRQVLEGAEFHE